MLQAFVALVKREQEEAERARKKEEEEKKQQREEQQRRKRMLEAAFEGDVEEMKAVLKEVKMSLRFLFPALHPNRHQVGRGDAPCLFLLHFQAVWPWNMSQGPLRDVLKYPMGLFHNAKGAFKCYSVTTRQNPGFMCGGVLSSARATGHKLE